jgi:uncharacterized protein (TIGR00299 family) protein
MKIIYFDCYAGISGDMAVGALIDLGAPLDYLQIELEKLGLPAGSYQLSTSRTERRHMSALKFDVAVNDHHSHRHYAGIDAMIAESALTDGAKERARRIFRRLAEAEALVHGVAIEQVHFHEVGAVDSIVDIVGAAVCLDYLGIEAVYASALPLGGGFVETAHGRLPVPAPATAELLKGLSVHAECGNGERVTPTGAAIVAALVSGCGAQPAMRIERIGSGAGAKDFPDCPNILRAFLGTVEKSGTFSDEIIVAETNIDDSTPELLGYVMGRLFEQGALDVWFAPIQMKKNRPAIQLSFICCPEQLESLSALVLSETSAIGLRYYPAGRIKLERRIEERDTAFGPIRFKIISDAEGLLRVAPEYDDCQRVARELGIPLQRVMLELSSVKRGMS